MVVNGMPARDPSILSLTHYTLVKSSLGKMVKRYLVMPASARRILATAAAVSSRCGTIGRPVGNFIKVHTLRFGITLQEAQHQQVWDTARCYGLQLQNPFKSTGPLLQRDISQSYFGSSTPRELRNKEPHGQAYINVCTYIYIYHISM